MYSNLFKSAEVIQANDVRIINSNAIVEKKLEKLAAMAKEEEAFDMEAAAGENIDPVAVAELISDDEPGETPDEELRERGESKEALRQANAMASDVLNQAKEEAARILEDAKADADRIRKETFEEAKRKGYEEGLNKATLEIAIQAKKLDEEKKKLEADYQSRIEEIEPVLVDTIADIYEHVFDVDLSERREIIIHLLNSTLGSLEGIKNFLVHISKEDYAFVSMKKKSLVEGTGIAPECIELVEDFALQKGNCIIETDGGIFDCGLQTQMENLRKELQMLSYQKA